MNEQNSMGQELNMGDLMNIADLPGVEGEEIIAHEPLVLVPIQSNSTDRSSDLATDYALVRQNLHFQSQMLMDATKILLELAKNSESPKFMDSFSNMMSQITSMNKEILRTHKEMRTITTEGSGATKPTPTQTVNVESAQIFVGSPADLMDKIDQDDVIDEQ